MFSTTHREDNCQDHRRLTTTSQRGYFGRCGVTSGDAGLLREMQAVGVSGLRREMQQVHPDVIARPLRGRGPVLQQT
jgi:hypothetical protein